MKKDIKNAFYNIGGALAVAAGTLLILNGVYTCNILAWAVGFSSLAGGIISLDRVKD